MKVLILHFKLLYFQIVFQSILTWFKSEGFIDLLLEEKKSDLISNGKGNQRNYIKIQCVS